VPDPALKYRLLPPFLDQTPGNAALGYYGAIEMYRDHLKPEDREQIEKWFEMEPSQLPRDEVNRMFDRFAGALHQVQLAARYEDCDWSYPVRTEAFGAMLPALGSYRALAGLVALKARFEIGQGEFESAAKTLQTGFAMARHMSSAKILVNDLVGASVGRTMARQVRAWIDTPGAPNLYWALTGLPAPFVELREAMDVEGSLAFLAVPGLSRLLDPMSPQEASRLLAEVNRMAHQLNAGRQDESWEGKLAAAAWVIKRYPAARQRLVELGRTPQEVEAMPTQQVVLLAALKQYGRRRDDLFKWCSVPYWQARPHFKGFDEQRESLRRSGDDYPFLLLIPNVHRAYYATTQLDRDIAALRCIEAIRLFAAANDGRLPASLGEITAVPLPIDPMTGESFIYTVEAGKAVLIAPALPGEKISDEIHYVLRMARP